MIAAAALATAGSELRATVELRVAMGGHTGLDLPPKFIRLNDEDPAWLRALPAALDALAERWSLTLDAHFPDLGYNYVAPATRVDGTRCVLKLSRHVADTRTEIAALRLWEGNGAASLLEADPEIGALLIERLDPGTMLVDVAHADDDAATRIAAGVLRQLWRRAPDQHELRPLESWCAAYDRNREALSGGVAGFPAVVFQRADALRSELLASTDAPVVLHGDLHHFNVLRARRADWLAIDPKGLVGDRCFDVCQFFRNPYPVSPSANGRRLDIFCAELGLDRPRTKAWCFVHAVLDACWQFEDGQAWQPRLAYAEDTLSF
jgi:streptomycin 6-kinase